MRRCQLQLSLGPKATRNRPREDCQDPRDCGARSRHASDRGLCMDRGRAKRRDRSGIGALLGFLGSSSLPPFCTGQSTKTYQILCRSDKQDMVYTVAALLQAPLSFESLATPLAHLVLTLCAAQHSRAFCFSPCLLAPCPGAAICSARRSTMTRWSCRHGPH